MTLGSTSTPPHTDNWATRTIVASVAWITRYPWLVLAICLGLGAAAVYVSLTRLEYHTQRDDLLSAEKACQKRWQKYLDVFGDDDDMVVVVEGSDAAKMKAALDAVADRVKQRTDLFDRVFYRADLNKLHDRALLYLPADQIEAVRTRVDGMKPLLGSLGPISWQSLSVQSLLAEAEIALEARAAGRELSPADRDLLVTLPAVSKSAAATLRDPAAYRNPWAVTAPVATEENTKTDVPAGGSLQQLTEPQYFFTLDGSLAMLVCRPKKTSESFTPAQEANDAMREVLAEIRPQFPEVQIGLTGLPILETDEMALSDIDSKRASWLALLAVIGLYFAVYRGFRFPMLTVSSLIVGTLWALGWATMTIGHLNILSSTFAVMLIGMGDYGVLWVARYDESRKRGESIDSAIRLTAKGAGPSILTAALTTALAFFATMLADFKAVAELGWIAGWGVIFCALSCLTLMPAALVIVERVRERRNARLAGFSARNDLLARRASKGVDSPTFLPFPTPVLAWLPGLAGQPKWVLAIGAVLVLGCGAFASRLTYDHNLLNLQSRSLESVAWEHKLIEKAAGATWDSLSLAHTREEALALKARYEALPEVGRVVEPVTLVPADQAAKLPAVRAIQERLAALPAADKIPMPLGSSPATTRSLATQVGRYAESDSALANAATELVQALDKLPSDVAATRLKEFERQLAADLAADLHRLKSVSHPQPITLEDLPNDFRERYVGAGGVYLVRAYARDSLWDYEALKRFTTSAATVDPEATGKAFRTLEGLHQMKIGFEWAGVYALGAIVLVLAFDFRRLQLIVLGLFPLAVGALMTLGVMGLCGVPLNPANMIALPLIVGVGIDNGMHVLHDFCSKPKGKKYVLGSAVGRGVLIKALTTILGFGTLMIARHQGMASLGLALTLGVTFSMFAALILLPALLQVIAGRSSKKPEAVEPKLIKMEKAAA